jgi:hypothetical protein
MSAPDPPEPDQERAEVGFAAEDVERRRGVRGPVRDLWAELPDGGRAPVLEAGRKGVFIALDEPDAFALGTRWEIAIAGAGGRAVARVELVRKEIQPRRGVALLIVHMAPAAEATYRTLLGE